MIKKVKDGYMVVSAEGKPLSKVLPTMSAAQQRLAQVEMFKHIKEKQ